MRRWGRVIDMSDYTPGSFLRLVTLIITILLIPLQLFCDGFVREKESNFIKELQDTDWLGKCQDHDSICSRIMSIPNRTFCAVEIVIYVLCGLILLADSWLAYKTALVTCLGIYCMGFMQVTFKSGRPFWDIAEISSNGYCYFDFAGPSEGAFVMTFFWPYVIIMFLFKYYKSPNKCINWTLLTLLLITWVDNYCFAVLNGLNYIY